MGADLISGGYLTTALVPLGEQWKKMKKILTSEVTGGVVNVRIATQHYCGNVIRKMIFNKRFFGKGMADGGPGVEEEEHLEEEIKAQIVEIMTATVDNPSNAVEWAIAEMINQPEMLQRAIEELDSVVGKKRLVQESDLSQLNYVKACAREAFRLHPVGPFNIPHVAISDTTVAGYFIPKGSHILLSRQGIGRNPKTWEEPLKFKPERHLKY
ncbi:hypothetical protein F0562_021603 [Nyssa sinensis]|uniref:Uncharacterized protein n=1 Tax=Nyssa sinensis TaxID=561372 RepID=A0A5J5BR54_9ASTE|nr:hypothetical protein F0562_021603 [Nyssa sinensis]